jgi:hypothetical protein
MRKYILCFYAFITTVIIGAVFLVGCGGKTESGTYHSDSDRFDCTWTHVETHADCQFLMNYYACNHASYFGMDRECVGFRCVSCN